MGNRLGKLEFNDASADIPLKERRGIFKFSEEEPGKFMCSIAANASREYDLGIVATDDYAIINNSTFSATLKTRGITVSLVEIIADANPNHGIEMPTGTWDVPDFERVDSDQASERSSSGSFCGMLVVLVSTPEALHANVPGVAPPGSGRAQGATPPA